MKAIKFNQQGIEAILNGSKTMTRRPLTDEQIFQRFHHVSENECSKYKLGETVMVEPATLMSYVPLDYIQDIYIKITNIKVERLQDISEDDCIKEGVKRNFNDDPDLKGNHISYGEYWILEIDSFRYDIWNNLPYKAPYDWESNPYVFVYEFEK